LEDGAKKFLQGFLDQLAASDKTNKELLAANRELLRTQNGIFTQNNQIIRALSTVSVQLGTLTAQLDGVAKRTDYLYDQMGRLGEIILSGEDPPRDTYVQPPGHSIDTAARRFARDAVDGFVSSIFPGQQGGGRTRSR